MLSNVYLAFGTIKAKSVMKIGKANDVKRREREIRISVEVSYPCLCEAQAFALESKLRDTLRGLGAIQFGNHNDWFLFDGDLYDKIKTVLTSESGFEALQEYTDVTDLVNFEINLYRKKYQDILRNERVNKMAIQRANELFPDDIEMRDRIIARLTSHPA